MPRLNMKACKNILGESKEDYLETILRLSVGGETVRPVDIARIHKVSKSSISNALSALGKAGYVEYEKYKPVRLTDAGRVQASKTFRKHRLLVKFLVEILGVSSRSADEAACKMEHAMGEKLAIKLAEFVGGIPLGRGRMKRGAPIPKHGCVRGGALKNFARKLDKSNKNRNAPTRTAKRDIPAESVV